MKEKNKLTRQWEKIWKEHTDPNEIKKKQREQIKNEIKEDKKSSFVYE